MAVKGQRPQMFKIRSVCVTDKPQTGSWPKGAMMSLMRDFLKGPNAQRENYTKLGTVRGY